MDVDRRLATANVSTTKSPGLVATVSEAVAVEPSLAVAAACSWLMVLATLKYDTDPPTKDSRIALKVTVIVPDPAVGFRSAHNST